MSDQEVQKDQIKSLEGDLRTAFSQKRYADVKLLADRMRSLDAENRIAVKLLEKIKKLEAKELKKLNAEKISKLEKDIKTALKNTQLDQIRSIANEITILDKENGLVKKILSKLAKIELKKHNEQQEKSVKGNVFTNLFVGKQEVKEPKKFEGNIVETIVAKKEESKTEEVKKNKIKKAEKNQEDREKERTGLTFLHLSRAAFHFTFLLLVVSAGFFYIQNVDINNRVLSLIGEKQNVASQLYSSAGELESRKTQERKLNKEIREYRIGYNNQFEETIKKVVKNRIDWNDIIQKINEVTESVYERNSLARYVVFNSYSFDVNTGEVRVSGTLSDPLGKNLTKLIELEDAFRTYPSNSSNSKDNVKPYFTGVKQIQTVSKSLDRRTNKYISNFQISFLINKEDAKK